MKPIFTRLAMLLVSILATLTASAYDFAVDGIYYNILSVENKNVEVTHDGDYWWSYGVSVSIPATVKYDEVSYNVVAIGEYAFSGCPSLTSVTIPNSVTSIGNRAFSGCKSLASISIPSSVLSIGNRAFSETALTSITIPSSVETLEEYCLGDIPSLESVTINGSPTIHYDPFPSSPALQYLNIKSGLKIAGDSELLILGTKLLTIRYSDPTVTTINMELINVGVTVDGKVLDKISYNSYWNGQADYIPIKKGKQRVKVMPNSDLRDKTYFRSDVSVPIWFSKVNSNPKDAKTLPLFKSLDVIATPAQIDANVLTNLRKGVDPDMESCKFYFDGKEIDGMSLSAVCDNLLPGKKYKVEVKGKMKGVNTTYSISREVTTPTLNWGEGEGVATSSTSARLMCETNLAQGTVGGFEWMRENAPSGMKPSKAPCPVVGGALTGSLRNLKDDVYYKCRPYYIDVEGVEHVGKWFIVFTGDAGVYFEPEVRTYSPSVSKSDGIVTLSGFALAGSDDITMQGFEYRPVSMTRANDEWQSVTAAGIMMNATLTGLAGDTEYQCRAFVETAKGRFYGAEEKFTTPPSAAIDDLSTDYDNVSVTTSYGRIIVSNLTGDARVKVYNMQGALVAETAERIIDNLSPDLYIVSAGSKTVKVMLK